MLGSSKMGRRASFRSKAAHFVSDLTTVLLNPISDNPPKTPPSPAQTHPPRLSNPDNEVDSARDQLESVTEDDSKDVVDGPDTSSFTAFMYSLLSSSEADNNSSLNGLNDRQAELDVSSSDSVVKRSGGKKSLYSKGKQSLSRAIYHAARIGGYHSLGSESKSNHGMKNGNFPEVVEGELMTFKPSGEPLPSSKIPDLSEPSFVLPEKTRCFLYSSLPAIVQGRKWVLLYSTWRHGISLATLYRRSMLWPGLSLLVVGDRKGAVFGGLVEAPLRPTSKKKYQGTNSTFVFTNTPGNPVVFRPTGVNRYYTLCSNDFLALGGGGHFALYLDSDLLTGSSSTSETYGNSCLAHSEDFEVKEVELWGFVYASKYEDVVALCRTETPGICRW